MIGDRGLIMKKLIIFFPGAGYGMECPLLYYADFIFETNGFDRIHMDYQSILSNAEMTLEDKLIEVRKYILERVKNIDFTSYDEIVFLSKSIGSVEAGILAEKLDLKVVQIFITPIEEAISYCSTDSYVVIGTKDKAYEIYKEYCDKRKIKVLYIKDANHSLEVEGNPYESIDVLKGVMRFIER